MELFRRGLALLCIVDSVLRIPQAGFYLSDLGVLPRSTYFSFFEQSYSWSLHLMSGRPDVMVVSLLMAAGLGLAQLLGKSNVFSRLLLWALILSVQNRNPALLAPGDDLLRILLFWDIFLPDSDARGLKSDVWGPAVLGLQVQLSLFWLCWAAGLSTQKLLLALQWAGVENSVVPVMAVWITRGIAVVVVAALWWCGLRLPAAVLGIAWLGILGWIYGFVFPLTAIVSLLALVKKPGRENSSSPRRVSSWLWGAVAVISLSAIGLNVIPSGSDFRLPFLALGQAAGLQQGRDDSFPHAGESLVDVVARTPAQKPVWSIGKMSGRRDRMFAQRLSSESAWGLHLEKALRTEFALGLTPHVWMRTEKLNKDLGLGQAEVTLVSRTPVSVDTRRAVWP